MIKKRSLHILMLFIILLCTNCYYKKENVTPVQQSWSSIVPLDIPIRQRLQLYESGNLVINHSFEDGKIFLDSNLATFNLKGWKKIGEHVEWVDTSSVNFSAGEASSGKHAIKIHRINSSEKETTGEGIQSDFIKVIPGKYELTVDIKLKQIQSNLERFGTKIFDAIYIKLYYFDKNKLPIDITKKYILQSEKIDNTFKGFPFSNFSKIDSTGWINMKCRSHSSPIYEGYIPDDARYVKVFIGLKGTGTMWVDNVNLQYTRNNFTLLERIRPLFDSTYAKHKAIFPTPKYAKLQNPIKYLKLDSVRIKYPFIVIPGYPDKQTRMAANSLKNYIDSIFFKNDSNYFINNNGVKIINQTNEEIIRSGNILFSIGETELFYGYTDSLPINAIAGKPDAYLIKSDTSQQIVFLYGNSGAGNLYAVKTALQLFDLNNPVFYYAEIIDWPGFSKRAVVIGESIIEKTKEIEDLNEQLSDYRFNNIYLNDDLNIKKWYAHDPAFVNCLNRLKNSCNNYGINYGIMLNPYSHLGHSKPVDSIDEQVKNKWNHSNSYSVNLLNYKINYALQRGVSFICIRSDMYLPYKNNPYNFVLYSQADKDEYFNLPIAQVFMINHIAQNIKANHNDVEIEFLPPWNNNIQIDKSKEQANYYYQDFTSMLKYDINYLWTGYDYKSYYIDKVDIMRYSQLINEIPVYFDKFITEKYNEEYKSFILNHPGRILLGDIFESDNMNFLKGLNNDIYKSKYILDFYPETELGVIKMAMIAEFIWNPVNFNTDMALWKILNIKYGAKLAKELIYFNKYYTHISSIYYKSISGKLEKKDEKSYATLYKQINYSLLRIRKYPNGDKLFNELNSLTDILTSLIPIGVD